MQFIAVEPASIGVIFTGVGAVVGAVASIILRKDDSKLSEMQLAWNINQSIQQEKDKRIDELSSTVNDLRSRVNISDQKALEMERRFYDCQQSNQAMSATLEFMRTMMPNVPFPVKKQPPDESPDQTSH